VPPSAPSAAVVCVAGLGFIRALLFIRMHTFALGECARVSCAHPENGSEGVCGEKLCTRTGTFLTTSNAADKGVSHKRQHGVGTRVGGRARNCLCLSCIR